jgi:cyanophycinase
VLEVLGKGTVTVVDGSRAQSDAFEVRARRPVLVSGVVLHALPPGYRFDLAARVLLPRLQAIGTPRRQARQEAAEELPPGRAARRRRTRGGADQEASQ